MYRERLTALLIISAACAALAGCGSFSRKVNQALPDFLRSEPGEEEIQRYQQRVRVLNRSEADTKALEAAFAEATVLFEAEEWEDAADAYQDFLDNFPDSKRDEEARYQLILALRRDEDELKTSKALKKFLKLYPISRYNKEVEEISFELGSEYVEGEHDGFLFSSGDEGVSLFRDQIANFPNGAYAADALWKIGNYYYDEGEYFDAAASYDTIIEKYGESKWASRALYNRALTRMTQIKGIEYDQRVMEQAVADFKTYLRDYPEADRREDVNVYIERIENMICEKQINIANWYDSQGFPGAARFVLTKAKKKWSHTEASKEIDGLLAALPAEDGIEILVPGQDPASPAEDFGEDPSKGRIQLPPASIPDSPPRPKGFPNEPADLQSSTGSTKP